MGLVFERIFARKRLHCYKIAHWRLMMGTKSNFGRMLGAERSLYALLSPSFMKQLLLKGQR